MANSEYNLTVVDGTALTISLSGPVGPAGATGATGATGPAGTGSGTVENTIINGSANAVSGDAVFDALALKAPLDSPSFTTPTLGAATATTVNKVTITAPATGATLTIADNTSITTGAGGYIDTSLGGYIKTGGYIDTSLGGGLELGSGASMGIQASIQTDAPITTNFNAPITTGLNAPISTLAGGSFATGTGDLTGPNANGTIALVNSPQTFSGQQQFSTRPTSSAAGTPEATSLITATDGDARYGREYYSVVATPIEAFSTAFVNGPNFVVPAGSYDFEIFVVIKAVGETSGANYNVACSPNTDVSLLQDTRLINVGGLGTGGTASTSFRNQTNAIGSADYIATYMDAPNNFASSHCRGSTVLASQTTINLRIKQRSATDAVNAAQILAGSFIRFTKR
jgi:hypothetical protein